MSTEAPAESFAKLRGLKNRLYAALRDAEQPLIADVVLRSGFHPYRDGAGRVLLAELIRRHRQSPRPIVPELTQREVRELADEIGIKPDLEPTRRLDVD